MSEFDAFISYSWHDEGRDVADQVRKLLTEDGKKIWIDEYQMKGDLTAGMARGIKDSYLFIVVTSRGYRVRREKTGAVEHRYNASASNASFRIA